MSYAIDMDDIRAAANRIGGVVHETPVLTCAALDALAGRRLFFKCEQFQKVGAFKFRGASNAVALLGDRATAGVVTHSSGNHAQALALAAQQRGVPAWIVMPSTANPTKRNAVAGYGANIIECEPTLAAREETAARVVRETGAIFVHPYDDPAIMAGQGTAALELHKQVPNLSAIITPVGGGGLLSGCAVATHALSPTTRVFAAEPTGADDAARSKAANKHIPQTHPDTIADGLLTSVGVQNWPIVRDLVEAVITVDDPEIVDAMRLLFERAKLLVEPSSATALAAVLSDRFKALEGIDTVGIVLSGGNVDLGNLPF